MLDENLFSPEVINKTREIETLCLFKLDEFLLVKLFFVKEKVEKNGKNAFKEARKIRL